MMTENHIIDYSQYHILFISYVDQTVLSSGSSVRPAKMLEAFRKVGCKVTALTGEQVEKERKREVKAVERSIQYDKPDLCYIESPTYPIMRHADRKLIKLLCDNHIPTGYFYRDFYRRFPNEFPRRTSVSGRIKDFGLDILQWLTDRALRYCDIVYVPSNACKPLLNYRDIRALPPAGMIHLPERKEFNYTGIYVGGITGHYDAELLVDTFYKLHKRNSSYKLILVCRENEWKCFHSPHKHADWIEVHHTSGEGLVPLYEKASFAAVVSNQKYQYNEFAISVKVFEYLSYGLPQVVTNTKAVAELIEKEKIGVVAESTPEAFADAIERNFANPILYAEYQENVRDSLTQRNLWEHRVKTVVTDLLEKKHLELSQPSGKLAKTDGD